VRQQGNLEEWLKFFLDGITRTSNNVVSVTRKLDSLFRNDKNTIRNFGRFKSSALTVHKELQKHPISTIKAIAEKAHLSIPAAANGMSVLEQLGIAREVTN